MIGERVNLMEWRLYDTDRYNEYINMINDFVKADRENTVLNVRYTMALANSFLESGGSDQYMFIGGMAVLGNIVRHSDINSIIRWRNSNDIDVILRSRNYDFLIETFFDKMDIRGKSLSIHNKLFCKGNSLDIEDRAIDETAIDAYIPNGDPRKGIPINDVCISDYHWLDNKTAIFFGIPVRIIDPITLLSMKFGIDNCKKLTRIKKDAGDIYNLLGVIERDGITPANLCHRLPNRKRNRLVDMISCNCNNCLYCELRLEEHLLTPSRDYLEGIKLRKNENSDSF